MKAIILDNVSRTKSTVHLTSEDVEVLERTYDSDTDEWFRKYFAPKTNMGEVSHKVVLRIVE